MASILKVDTIQDQSGNNIINESADTITIGASGDTITIPAGATISNLGTASGFGTNTPAFLARNSALQAISDDTMTKVQFNSVLYDTESGAYDNVTNYRFTVPSGQGGKYAVYSTVIINSEVNSNLDGVLIEMRKNNTALNVGNNELNFLSNPIRVAPVSFFSAIELSAGDYLEVYCRIEAADSTGGVILASSSFGAYKLLG
jgi:hypothetical protein